ASTKIKVYGVGGGNRDELVGPEHACRRDNTIVPTVTVKNAHEDQSHISILFARPFLHRMGTVSLPQLHRPRRIRASVEKEGADGAQQVTENE
ncbi:unnamed protein product, partial [Amoebophrya sp. A25]